MNSVPTLLKPKELCSIFGVSVKTIYLMLYRDDIPGAFQLGKNWYINQDTLFKELEKKASLRSKPRSLNDDPNSGRHGITS